MRPVHTPQPLKALILSSILFSLLGPIIGPYLALSLAGIQHLFIWQFITYAFTQSAPLGITFPFLLHIGFNMYLLWIFGASLIERTRVGPFFALYFTAILVGGVFAYFAMALFHLPFAYAGTTAPLYAVLTAWTLLNQDADIRILFTIPFRASWLLLGLIGANLLVDLSQRDWIHLFSYFGTFLYAYLFTLIVYRARTSIPFLQTFEKTILRFIEKFRRMGKKESKPRSAKIYDIKSGDPVMSDDEFMDAMLARISLHGEDSLTPQEKLRMKQISKNKSKK